MKGDAMWDASVYYDQHPEIHDSDEGRALMNLFKAENERLQRIIDTRKREAKNAGK